MWLSRTAESASESCVLRAVLGGLGQPLPRAPQRCYILQHYYQSSAGPQSGPLLTRNPVLFIYFVRGVTQTLRTQPKFPQLAERYNPSVFNRHVKNQKTLVYRAGSGHYNLQRRKPEFYRDKYFPSFILGS